MRPTALSSRRLLAQRLSCILRPQANYQIARAIQTKLKMPDAFPCLRTNIGIVGNMNAGKSTLMNSMTQQATSIVDATPGTTADVKVALMELHGLGPVKVFDTAGVDDAGELGEKKAHKTKQCLKEVDLAVIVVDPSSLATVSSEGQSPSLDATKLSPVVQAAAEVMRRGHHILPVFNLRQDSSSPGQPAAMALVKDTETALRHQIMQAMQEVKLTAKGRRRTSAGPQWAEGLILPAFSGDLSSEAVGNSLARHVVAHYDQENGQMPYKQLLPPEFMDRDRLVFLNIPMDEETPGHRLLRPQAMVQEYCLRHYTPTLAYRMDLKHGRSPGQQHKTEMTRFQQHLGHLPLGSLVITDSQAVDLVHEWTLDDYGHPIVNITTFSVTMINYMSGGCLADYVQGLRALLDLKDGDKVLITEVCNHMRIPDICDDIGTVQIPKGLARFLPNTKLQLDHAYGREFPPPEELGQYKLVIHCGGCMADRQKMEARLEDCREAGVPITNYGLLLSYLFSPFAFERVLKPWGVRVPEELKAPVREDWGHAAEFGDLL